MAVEIHGSGDPLVMIHGLGGTSNVYSPQTDTLARFFQVIRPDLPGSGRTPAPGPLTIESLADSVAALCDERKIATAHFVGHSMGTIVCQHLAVKHPRLAKSLALIGPLAAPPDAARVNITARAAKARSEGMVGIAEAIVQGGLSAATRAAKPEAAAFVRESQMRQDAEGYALTCEALAAAEPAAVESLTCPVLLITGSEDATAPPGAVRTLARRIPGSRLTILPNCGHWAMIECAAEVTEALINFYFSRD